MPANTKEGAGTFSSTAKGGKWRRAQGHPHHPSPSSESSDHPSPGVVPKTALRVALEQPGLLASALPGSSWGGWRALLLAAMGEALKDDELETFRRLTERQQPPAERVSELVAVVGRRGGKSRAIATLLCYLACLVDYRGRLASGETGVALCIAPSQEQAKIVLDYAAGILEASPILRQLVKRSTSETIEFTNRIVISVRSASYRRLRGQTCIACIADEAAFWFSEDSSNPDYEILNAVRPSLATTGGLLCVISSPYARRGVLWDSFKNHFGANGNPSILVAKAATRELNPSLSEAFVDREYEKDPVWAAAEYGAEFRTDIENFITNEAIEACIDAGIRERPYDRRNIYSAFTDPSGGASDSFTLAIAHKEGMSSVLDAVREIRPPFSPEQAVEEFCSLLRQYMVYGIRSDRYGGEWVTESFRRRGVMVEPSEHSKSQLYQDALPMINSRTAALLDNNTLRRQLVMLERKTTRGGKDSIDHSPGAKDDLANAVAGALVYAGKSLGDPNFWNAELPKVKGIV
jgi:hypothetical protein